MTRPTCVLWDLDDTLLNTLPGRITAMAHAYETLVGGKVDARALWISSRGSTVEEIAKRLVGVDYTKFAAVYRERYYTLERDVKPFEGVAEVLSELAAVELPMAVVTSKVSWGATEELSQTGLLQYFQAVVGADDCEQHKPDPEPVYTAMDRLCLTDADSILFVGDSPADVWAARNAGCTSVAALWGTLDRAMVLDAMPDLVAETPEQLLALLAERAEVDQ